MHRTPTIFDTIARITGDCDVSATPVIYSICDLSLVNLLLRTHILINDGVVIPSTINQFAEGYGIGSNLRLRPLITALQPFIIHAAESAVVPRLNDLVITECYMAESESHEYLQAFNYQGILHTAARLKSAQIISEIGGHKLEAARRIIEAASAPLAFYCNYIKELEEVFTPILAEAGRALRGYYI